MRKGLVIGVILSVGIWFVCMAMILGGASNLIGEAKEVREDMQTRILIQEIEGD